MHALKLQAKSHRAYEQYLKEKQFKYTLQFSKTDQQLPPFAEVTESGNDIRLLIQALVYPTGNLPHPTINN